MLQHAYHPVIVQSCRCTDEGRTTFKEEPGEPREPVTWVSSLCSIGASSSGGISGAKARAASWRTAM